MASDQQFCLRWNNHQSTLVSVFDNLLESQTLVDCTLAADGQYLKAHKVVLSACSPYLEAILCQNLDKHPILILKDVKFSELKAMLDYMYRGEVNISQEQLSTFLKAAESLQIKGLTDSGGGGSSERDREREPLKRQDLRKPLTQPVPHIPQPRPVVPHPGLMERRSLPHFPPHIADMQPQSPRHAREGSTSPTARKRRRPNRPSSDDSNFVSTPNSLSENQPDTSDSCDVPVKQAAPSTPNVPNATTKAPETDSNRTTPQPQNNQQNSEQKQQVTVKKEFSEALLTPKTEFDYGNDNSMEDVTYEDDEEEEVDLSKPGTSFAANSQGFPPWQMGGDGSNDDSNNMYSPDVTAATNQNNSQGIYRVAAQSKKSNVLDRTTQVKGNLCQNRLDFENVQLNQFDTKELTVMPVTAQIENTNGLTGLNKSLNEINDKLNKIKVRSDLFSSLETSENEKAYKICCTENEIEFGVGTVTEVIIESGHEDESPMNIGSMQVTNKPKTLVSQAEAIICDKNSLCGNKEMGDKRTSVENTLVDNFGFNLEEETEKEKLPDKMLYNGNMNNFRFPSEIVVSQTESVDLHVNLVDSSTAMLSAKQKCRPSVIKRCPLVENEFQHDNACNKRCLNKSIGVLPLPVNNMQQTTPSVCSMTTCPVAKPNGSTCRSWEPLRKSVQKDPKAVKENVMNSKSHVQISPLVNLIEKKVTKVKAKPEPKIGLLPDHSLVSKVSRKDIDSKINFTIVSDIPNCSNSCSSIVTDVPNLKNSRSSVVTENPNLLKNSHSSVNLDNHPKLPVKKVKLSSDSHYIQILKDSLSCTGRKMKSKKKELKNKEKLRCEYCMLIFKNEKEIEQHSIEYHSSEHLFF